MSKSGRRISLKSWLLVTTLIVGLNGLANEAFAQAATPAASANEEIVVTGTRLRRQDYIATSPIATVTQEQLVRNADITLDTYLNTLPQVVGAGTTTTNNPPNDGQANIDLRGLGANRNLVLLDGRRPMVSSNDLTVDVNTIPSALIESAEVITGGAGAVYGADAIAGVVNIKLKQNFQGLDFRASYGDSLEHWDANEYNISAVIGGNFGDDKGNATLAFDRSYREPMYKRQREFAKNATSTTTRQPDGVLFYSGANNPIAQSAVDAVFAQPSHGSNAPGTVLAQSGNIGFNANGTLFALGTFNSPRNVVNFRGNPDDPNPRFFPDFYSYNFDPVNLLTLPMDRYSLMGTFRLKIYDDIEFYAQGGWTRYQSETALAPTPFPTVFFAAPGENAFDEVATPLIESGGVTTSLVVPVTNPYVQANANLLALLNSRTGDDPNFVGSGATEPFLFRNRFVQNGLRTEAFENTVTNWLGGFRGPIADSGWNFDVYFSSGRTVIDDEQSNNIDTQLVQNLIASPDGGASFCAGGLDLFGPRKLSPDCVSKLGVTSTLRTKLQQQILSGYVAGNFLSLPAGPVQWVFGAENRRFDYSVDPGPVAGPVSGLNTRAAEEGNNSFLDGFTEALLPITSDIEVTLGYRLSRSEFKDDITGISSEAETSSSYKATGTWKVADPWLLRATYQRSVRAPNFDELFQGGGDAPQIFDPCSLGTAQRAKYPVQMAALCTATGVPNVATFIGTPGTQADTTTAGNPNLKPETADTYTLGVAFTSPWQDNPWLSKLQVSLDYYSIKIEDAILPNDSNALIASCYNYYGTNPTFSDTFAPCAGLIAVEGRIPDIVALADPSSADGSFIATNDGEVQTSGLDFQIDWGYDLGGWGTVSLNTMISYLIEYKLRDTVTVPAIDFAGTVNYFGGGGSVGLGQTLPEWRATVNGRWEVGKFGINGRARFIDSMENRASLQYPGETQFSGVPSVWYFDASVDYKITEKVSFQFGINNIADKQPPVYDPNVQSGTDPSTYDIIGRRFFASVHAKF